MDTFLKTLGGFGVSDAGFLITSAVVLVLGLAFIFPSVGLPVLGWFFGLAPIWLPILLVLLFWRVWIWYVRAQYINSQDISVLEIRIPSEIEKSPRAMEAVFSGLHFGPGETTFIHRWWKGQVRPWFSFELVSIGGRISFYVWTRTFFKDILEAQVYAQYPEVEIYEVEDYATKFKYDPNAHSVWGCDFVLSGKDAYPIKTYVDYELDKDPKEEYKVDPIAHLFEFLSMIGDDEQVWLQIMIRTNKDQVKKEGALFGKEDRWKAEGKKEIAEIMEEATPEYQSLNDPDQIVKGAPLLVNPTDRLKIEAIERSLGKQGFDAGIRGIYIAGTDTFNANRIGGLTGIFKQFGSAHLNGFKPTGWMTVFDYPWQGAFGGKEKTKAGIIDAYKRRSWFHPPYKSDHFVLTTEELATIYHFPSRTIQAPGLARVSSAKQEAPPNLPF